MKSDKRAGPHKHSMSTSTETRLAVLTKNGERFLLSCVTSNSLYTRFQVSLDDISRCSCHWIEDSSVCSAGMRHVTILTHGSSKRAPCADDLDQHFCRQLVLGHGIIRPQQWQSLDVWLPSWETSRAISPRSGELLKNKRRWCVYGASLICRDV